MYIPNDDTKNYPFCGLNLVVKTFEHSTSRINQSKFTKVPKVVMPTNKKMLLVNFKDQFNKSMGMYINFTSTSYPYYNKTNIRVEKSKLTYDRACLP